jgi:hypothetical protein
VCVCVCVCCAERDGVRGRFFFVAGFVTCLRVHRGG